MIRNCLFQLVVVSQPKHSSMVVQWYVLCGCCVDPEHSSSNKNYCCFPFALMKLYFTTIETLHPLGQIIVDGSHVDVQDVT